MHESTTLTLKVPQKQAWKTVEDETDIFLYLPNANGITSENREYSNKLEEMAYPCFSHSYFSKPWILANSTFHILFVLNPEVPAP